MGRSEKAAKNIAASMVSNVAQIALRFISRTILIYTLGEQYLGVGSLFNSIFAILNLSELGIGSAIIYSMYKPVAENNREKILELIQIYKNTYRKIAAIIGICGLLLLPFLGVIIKDSASIGNLQLIFLLFLADTVMSYLFFSYKFSIVSASQKEYVITEIKMVASITASILQALVLIFFHSYILYVGIGVIMNVTAGIVINGKVRSMYPYINDKPEHKIPEKERKELFQNIQGMAMYKISSTVLTSTDSIVLSAFLGVAMVGIYDNYNYIWLIGSGLCMILFNSYTPTIGNLIATEDREKSKRVFKALNFANFWVYGVIAIEMYTLMSCFIELWIGERYVLPEYIVLLIVINFITAGLQNAVITYKDAAGLFHKGRWRPVASAILNIIFSVILVNVMGIAGVILGTILSRMLTTWWFDAWMVHTYVFQEKPVRYYLRYWKSFFLILGTMVLCKYICGSFMTEITWISFFIGGIVCFLIPNLLFYLLFRKNEDFQYCAQVAKRLGAKLRQKGKSLLSRG